MPANAIIGIMAIASSPATRGNNEKQGEIYLGRYRFERHTRTIYRDKSINKKTSSQLDNKKSRSQCIPPLPPRASKGLTDAAGHNVRKYSDWHTCFAPAPETPPSPPRPLPPPNERRLRTTPVLTCVVQPNVHTWYLLVRPSKKHINPFRKFIGHFAPPRPPVPRSGMVPTTATHGVRGNPCRTSCELGGPCQGSRIKPQTTK